MILNPLRSHDDGEVNIVHQTMTAVDPTGDDRDYWIPWVDHIGQTLRVLLLVSGQEHREQNGVVGSACPWLIQITKEVVEFASPVSLLNRLLPLLVLPPLLPQLQFDDPSRSVVKMVMLVMSRSVEQDAIVVLVVARGLHRRTTRVVVAMLARAAVVALAAERPERFAPLPSGVVLVPFVFPLPDDPMKTIF